MKHHGNYILPTAEELALDLLAGGAQAREYVRRQLQRHRKKHHNDKRHLQKLKRL